ncbi:MAG: helix-turn-helix transcriptional regulator [Actinomycetia bacterium]|nr:helix-turn-helix transcriptional regulator [Actinomycetes bacterium]
MGSPSRRQELSAAPGWDALGLTPFDRAVYLAVLRAPDAGTAGWATALSASPVRVRRAARRLLQQGLLRRPARGRGTPEPVDPREALRSLARRRQEDTARFTAAAHDLGDQLGQEYEQGRVHRRPDGILEVIEGGASVTRRVAELVAGAERELCGIEAPPYVGAQEPMALAEAEALARGVRFRSLYAAAVLGNPARLAHITAMVAGGEEARVLAEAPLKLLLIDRRSALLPLTVDESIHGHRALVVHGSALVNALQALFEALWRQGAPVRSRGRFPDRELLRDGGLDAGEQELVELLGAGMTDESIARQFGVSVRTLRRRVRVLQDRLGSTGRFQAGVRAAQRGWL